jgi:hypothetical protein
MVSTKIFNFFIMSSLSLWLTQTPIQWKLKALYLRGEVCGHEAAHSLPSTTEVKNKIHGVLLKAQDNSKKKLKQSHYKVPRLRDNGTG